jgi:hypothetical protein
MRRVRTLPTRAQASSRQGMLSRTYACIAQGLNNVWMNMECDMTDEQTLRREQPLSLASCRA